MLVTKNLDLVQLGTPVFEVNIRIPNTREFYTQFHVAAFATSDDDDWVACILVDGTLLILRHTHAEGFGSDEIKQDCFTPHQIIQTDMWDAAGMCIADNGSSVLVVGGDGQCHVWEHKISTYEKKETIGPSLGDGQLYLRDGSWRIEAHERGYFQIISDMRGYPHYTIHSQKRFWRQPCWVVTRPNC